MKPDVLRAARALPPRRVAPGALLAVAVLLGACATPPPVTGDGGVSGSDLALAVDTAIEYARFTRVLGPAELERERQALALSAGSPLNQVLQAIALAQPQGGNLPRALALLDAVEASEQPEAVALRPLARLLADQYAERQRLEATAQRLTHQLERTGQQLKESQRQAEQLQEKLDALAEIERSLAPRPATNSTSLPSPPTERRSPR
jgi:hypothetical protein